MTATISPEIVQPAFGLGNLSCWLWLPVQGPSGPVFHGGYSDVCAKRVFSSIGRAATLATVAALALTAVEPMAYAGSAPKEKGVTAATGTSDATDISARRYYRGGGGGVLPRRQPLPASSAPALRSPQPRTVATITTPMVTTAADRSIMMAGRIITAMAITAAIGRACRIIADTPTPAGN